MGRAAVTRTHKLNILHLVQRNVKAVHAHGAGSVCHVVLQLLRFIASGLAFIHARLCALGAIGRQAFAACDGSSVGHPALLRRAGGPHLDGSEQHVWCRARWKAPPALLPPHVMCVAPVFEVLTANMF